MESKKINQLATELAPVLSDLTIIGDPTTGISKKITLSQMASLFTGTVEEYPNLASFPLVGTADTIYIALDTNIIYRWNTGTSAYVELSPNIVTSLVFSDANGFDGTISLVGSTATLTITTALTTGSVPFIGASGALSQDNANLFFDDTNNRLGINTNSPTTALDVFGSGIIGRLNGTSTNNAYLGFASAGSNKWSIGNVQSDHRFRIFSETNTSELVSVLQTGEFGIGIANPTTKLHIDGGASALIANLDADISIAKSISFRSDNSNRINLEVSGTESGSNAGANFFLRTYTDAGALLATPITITRSTGAISLATALSGTSAIFTGLNVGNATTASASININSDSSTAAYLYFNGAGVTNNHTYISGLQGATSNLTFYTSNTLALTIASTGISTFANSVNIAGDLALTPNDSAITFSSGAGRFFTGGSEKMRISSTGNLGLGTTNPTSISTFTTLEIRGTTGGGIKIGKTSTAQFNIQHDGTDAYFNNTANGSIYLYTNDTERLKIGSTGTFNFYSDVQLPVGNYVQWLAYSDANSRSWALRSNETTIGDFAIVSSSTNNNTLNTVRLRIPNDGTLVKNGDSSSMRILPQTDNVGYVGESSKRWAAIYAANGTIQTSDGREKTDITNTDLGLNFINSLRPVSYKWIVGENIVTYETITNEDGTEKQVEIVTPRAGVRTHYGFIAQEVKEVLGDKDFGGYVHDKETDKMSLRYDQFIAPLVKAIQEQQAQIEELKTKIR
jgi:hypothetical protein